MNNSWSSLTWLKASVEHSMFMWSGTSPLFYTIEVSNAKTKERINHTKKFSSKQRTLSRRSRGSCEGSTRTWTVGLYGRSDAARFASFWTKATVRCGEYKRRESTNHGNIYRKPDVLPPISGFNTHQHKQLPYTIEDISWFLVEASFRKGLYGYYLPQEDQS